MTLFMLTIKYSSTKNSYRFRHTFQQESIIFARDAVRDNSSWLFFPPPSPPNSFNESTEED